MPEGINLPQREDGIRSRQGAIAFHQPNMLSQRVELQMSQIVSSRLRLFGNSTKVLK
ncbi:hypothetical protein ACQ4M4_06530 [Leptolyngbya sp. AN02str]|uniref:hypothetical protein n=1 Tax=Leptolyngbya sp. AN02str TaxID=3423363 RepID=UPI003D31EB01